MGRLGELGKLGGLGRLGRTREKSGTQSTSSLAESTWTIWTRGSGPFTVSNASLYGGCAVSGGQEAPGVRRQIRTRSQTQMREGWHRQECIGRVCAVCSGGGLGQI